MKAAGGMGTFDLGHKTTFMLEGDYDDHMICCQSLVLYFLKHHGYVENASGIRRYQLTVKGKHATRRDPEAMR